MTADAWITVAVIVAMFVGLLQERLSPDILVMGAVAILALTGVLQPGQVFAGFASPSVATVAALFVVAGAMRSTGALQDLSQQALGSGGTVRSALVRLTSVTTAASAFLNNTPVVAMLMPAVISWARRRRISPSKLLIPLSYAAIAGGVCTLIGTSTNLVVSNLLTDHQLPPFSMFELSRVGIPCAVVAILYLVLVAPRLLPDRMDSSADPESAARQYLVEMRLEAGAPLAGMTIEQGELRHLPGLFLMRIERDGLVISPVGPDEVLRAEDLLSFVGVAETIVDLQKFRGLVPQDREDGDAPATGWHLQEIVIAPNSNLIGQNVREVGFRRRFNAAVVAVHRRGERIRSKIGDIRLREGDVLLVEAAAGFSRVFRDSTNFYLLSGMDDAQAPRHGRRFVAWAILVAVVFAAAVGLVPVAIAALAGALGAIATRCLTPAEARGAIDATVLIVIAAALALAKALEQTGIAALVADGVVGVGRAFGPIGVLATIYLATAILTELITNVAAAALIFPIALAAAEATGADARPFAIAVAVAASLSLATPLGYQTNLMVYGPGGYRFTDFLRTGLPLQILLGAVALSVISLLLP